jgi:hypothetical protein
MTRVRRMAVDISNWIVGMASQGSREWAEGLAREVTFIEGDGTALRWALGSVRVLFDRSAPINSLADALAIAKKYVKSVRGGGAGLIIVITQGPWYAYRFFHATSPHMRAGCAMVVFSAIAAIILLLIEWRKMKEPPSDDILVSALFYKTELEHCCSRLWISHIALVFLLWGG